jgi:hypothetical protein
LLRVGLDGRLEAGDYFTVTNRNLVKLLTGLDVLFDSVADRARADHAERATALDRAMSRAALDVADVALETLARERSERAEGRTRASILDGHKAEPNGAAG